MKNLTIKRDPSGQTSVHLVGLKPSAFYNVRVVARNESHHSQPADHVFITLKDNDCIPNLQRVRADPLVINWTYDCEESQLKEITSYFIVYESPTDYRRFSVEKVVTEYRFCELNFNTTYSLSVTAVAQNGILRESNILSLSIDKYSDEVTSDEVTSDTMTSDEVTDEVSTVKAVIPTDEDNNTGLIAGLVVLGVLFMASGLFALYLLRYTKRFAIIHMVHRYFHSQNCVGLASGMKPFVRFLVLQLAEDASQ